MCMGGSEDRTQTTPVFYNRSYTHVGQVGAASNRGGGTQKRVAWFSLVVAQLCVHWPARVCCTFKQLNPLQRLLQGHKPDRKSRLQKERVMTALSHN